MTTQTVCCRILNLLLQKEANSRGALHNEKM